MFALSAYELVRSLVTSTIETQKNILPQKLNVFVFVLLLRSPEREGIERAGRQRQRQNKRPTGCVFVQPLLTGGKVQKEAAAIQRERKRKTRKMMD